MTRILLLEADDAGSAAVDDALRFWRACEVVRARTLLEGIRAAGEGSFDAALVDAELPDGSGLDILGFLRVGSPGVRILLLTSSRDEGVAMDALTRGASDVLAMDKHLEQELPRRMDALLESADPMRALVSTLAPARAASAAAPALAPHHDERAAVPVLEGILRERVRAAGVWDLSGRPIAAVGQDDIDVDGVGSTLAALHAQVGSLWSAAELMPRGYRIVIEVYDGVLAAMAIPGPFVVAVFLESGTSARRAGAELDRLARTVSAALAERPDDDLATG